MNDEVLKSEEVHEQEEDPYERKHPRATIPALPDGSNILPPFGIRCGFQSPARLARFLLAYHLYFLLPVGTLFWLVFLIIPRY